MAPELTARKASVRTGGGAGPALPAVSGASAQTPGSLYPWRADHIPVSPATAHLPSHTRFPEGKGLVLFFSEISHNTVL